MGLVGVGVASPGCQALYIGSEAIGIGVRLGTGMSVSMPITIIFIFIKLQPIGIFLPLP